MISILFTCLVDFLSLRPLSPSEWEVESGWVIMLLALSCGGKSLYLSLSFPPSYLFKNFQAWWWSGQTGAHPLKQEGNLLLPYPLQPVVGHVPDPLPPYYEK